MEPEFEITENTKPIPQDMHFFTPAAEAAAIVKRLAVAREQAEKMRTEEKQKENKILGKLATYVFLMDKALIRFEKLFVEKGLKDAFREFRVLKNQMHHTLEEYGVSIIDPTNKVLDSELEEKVEIIGWVFGEGENRVKETHEPIVLKDNEVIKLGQIIASSPSATKRQREGGAKDEDQQGRRYRSGDYK